MSEGHLKKKHINKQKKAVLLTMFLFLFGLKRDQKYDGISHTGKRENNGAWPQFNRRAVSLSPPQAASAPGTTMLNHPVPSPSGLIEKASLALGWDTFQRDLPSQMGKDGSQ